MTFKKWSFPQKNAFIVIVFTLLIDHFFWIINRFSPASPPYRTASISIEMHVASALWVIGIGFILFSITLLISKPAQIGLRINIKNISIFGIILSIINYYMMERGFRYISGSLFGIKIFFYVINISLFCFVMLSYARYRMSGYPHKHLFFIYLYIASQILNIDGSASALTIMIYIILINDLKFKKIDILIYLFIFFFFMFYGMLKKYAFSFSNTLPRDKTLFDILIWTLSRLAIKTETFYIWLQGKSFISSFGDYSNLLLDSFLKRIKFIFGINSSKFPKSLSAAIFYDLYGTVQGGSSPGIVYGLAISWFGFGFIGFLCGFLIKNFFFSIKKVIHPITLTVLSYHFSCLMSDIFEIQIIFSPSFALFAASILATMIKTENIV